VVYYNDIIIIITSARALCRLKSSDELIFATMFFAPRADNAYYNDIYVCTYYSEVLRTMVSVTIVIIRSEISMQILIFFFASIRLRVKDLIL